MSICCHVSRLNQISVSYAFLSITESQHTIILTGNALPILKLAEKPPTRWLHVPTLLWLGSGLGAWLLIGENSSLVQGLGGLLILGGIALVRMEREADAPLEPGSAVLFCRQARHRIDNTGTVDMKLFWVFAPPGLEDWFNAIGRPRRAGEPMPPPFERPADVAEVQARLKFVPPRG